SLSGKTGELTPFIYQSYPATKESSFFHPNLMHFRSLSFKMENRKQTKDGILNMKTAVVTDSTAYIPKELREKLNIYMIPLSVIFGNETYREEIDISASEFYEEVK